MTEEEYREWMRSQIGYRVNVKHLAERWGVSQTYLSMFMAGKRSAGEKLLKATGFEIRYVKVDPQVEEVLA